MFTLIKPYASRFILGLLGLTLAFGSVAAQVQPAGKEPIAYIGHGAMFDPSGHEVAPSLAFLRSAQAWYRNALLAQLPADQRTQLSQLEGRLTKGLELSPQSQLVVNAHLLEWLAQTAPVADRGPLLGKIRLMKLLLDTALPETARAGSAQRRLAPLQVPAALLKRLQTDLPTGAGPQVKLVTGNGGAAYRAACLANGVP